MTKSITFTKDELKVMLALLYCAKGELIGTITGRIEKAMEDDYSLEQDAAMYSHSFVVEIDEDGQFEIVANRSADMTTPHIVLPDGYSLVKMGSINSLKR